jgi:hypothetical protein
MLVFLSHSTADRAFVEQKLIPFLESQGVKAWYSPDDIHTADDWQRAIVNGLKSSDYVLVVLSPDSVSSDWVRAEVHWSLENRKGRVVPVMIASCRPSDLHLKLELTQQVDLREDSEIGWSKLTSVWRTEIANERNVPASPVAAGSHQGAYQREARSRPECRLGYIDFNVSPDGGTLELTFDTAPVALGITDSDYALAATPFWPIIVELMSAFSGCATRDLQLSVPRSTIKEFPNPAIVAGTVTRNVQRMAHTDSYWKTVSGRIHLRGWAFRTVDDNFADISVTPYTKYDGQFYVPPSRSAKTKSLAVELVPRLQAGMTHLVSCDMGRSGIVVRLAEPVWEKEIPPYGGGGFVYRGIVTGGIA